MTDRPENWGWPWPAPEARPLSPKAASEALTNLGLEVDSLRWRFDQIENLHAAEHGFCRTCHVLAPCPTVLVLDPTKEEQL